MFSYRSIPFLCAAQLVAVAAWAEESSPPASASIPAASPDEPPPLEGGPTVPSPVPSEAPGGATSAPSSTAPRAQEETVTARPADPCEPPPEAPVVDSDAVFRAFAVLAASERDRRIVGAVAGVAAGVTTIAVGALLAEPTGTDEDVWYVFGGITVGVSLIGLLVPSPAEGLARSFRVRDAGHSAAEARALEIKWNDYALASKRRRITGGAIGLLVSAAFVGSGIAIATGAGDFSQNDRDFWGTFLIASGATVGVSGLANLVVKSSAERSLEAYRAVRPEPVALVPLLVAGPGGLMAGARGQF